MHITDPVADMLTRIRNANNAKHETVDVPASNMKKSIAQILLDEGYIKAYQVVDDGTQGTIHITLKYNAGKEGIEQCRELAECPLPSPPVWKSPLRRTTLSPSRAPRVL